MATSGTLYSSIYTDTYKYRLKFTWTETETSITDNTSTISWTLATNFRSDNSVSGVYAYVNNITVTINNNSVYSKQTSTKYSNDTTITTGTTTVTHSSDGTGTLSVSIGAGMGSSTQNSTGNSSWSLTTILRSSSFSVSSTQVSLYNGTTTLTITPQATNTFTHKIQVSCNGDSYTDITTLNTSTTSYTFTLSASKYGSRLKSTSNYIYLKVITLSDSTSIGEAISSKITVTATNSNLYPTVSLAISDSTGYLSTYLGYVKGKSKVVVTSTATVKYSAGISSHKVSDGSGVTAGTTTITTATYTANGQTFTGTIVDSRGNSATASTTPTYYDYFNPTLTDTNAYRIDDDGNASDEGAHIKVVLTYKIADVNNKNSKTVKISQMSSQSDSYTVVTTKTGDDLSYSGTISDVSFDADTDLTYKIKIEVIDGFTTVTKILDVSTAYSLIDFGANGQSVAIGKVSANTDKLFEIASDWSMELGTLTTPLSATTGNLSFVQTHSTSGLQIAFGVGSNGTNRGLFDRTNSKWILYCNAADSVTPILNGNTTVNGTLTASGATTLNSTLNVSGAVSLTRTQDASGTADNSPALRIGSLTGDHLEFDTNEIMAKASGTTTGPLYINGDGGTVYLGKSGETAATVMGNATVNGTLTSTGLVTGTAGFKVGSHTTVIGSVLTANGSATVASGNDANLASITLPAGTWVMTGQGNVSSNVSGVILINFSTTSADSDTYTIAAQRSASPSSSQKRQLNMTAIVTPTANTTYYLVGYSYGASATISGIIKAVRIA